MADLGVGPRTSAGSSDVASVPPLAETPAPDPLSELEASRLDVGSVGLEAALAGVLGVADGVTVGAIGVGTTALVVGGTGVPGRVVDSPCWHPSAELREVARAKARLPRLREIRMAAPYFSRRVLAMGSLEASQRGGMFHSIET